jgi:hypothetical protein
MINRSLMPSKKILVDSFNTILSLLNSKLSFVLLFSGVLLCNTSNAQSSSNSLKVEFKLDDAVSSANISTIPDVILTANFSDTTNASKLIITLGSTLNGTQHFSYAVNLDGSNLPQGITLQREGLNLIVNTGAHSGVVQYYASAKLQYANGSFSAEEKINNVE